MKDAAAFHNAYGGYIVFGVKDKGSDRVIGVESGFVCADFNKTLQKYTGTNIECLYNTIELNNNNNSGLSVGLLLIPRRDADASPVKFQRRGPNNAQGKPCFMEEIYVRIRDECRPATNTHEDWSFLHSDRLPPERIINVARIPVQSYLPARDEDLVEFVGRSEQLAALRQWIADPRSPTRLITGIGGLGKTTLAYYFAEEVADVGAGGVDSVIWLTAKQQTYSALRGRMVPTTRVDFHDIRSLFEKILKFLNYEFLLDDDDPSDADIIDRTVEALTIYPAMIVVDDLDSLAPEQQKETVAALNNVALRTVGRDLPPSRILMTSRLDQGLPLTSIIKIHGLGSNEFSVYLNKISSAFGIGNFTKKQEQNILVASSGSPLFAASIMRLIKLGEKPSDVIAKWRGVDGEEVRTFAFERELSRLTAMQTRVLYAAMLLGEASLEDVGEVLEMTSRVVRDQVSELQAYHLVSTITRPGGRSIISVPDELQSVIGIVRDNLQSQAKSIDEAVARAHAQSGGQEKVVGQAIRSIARAWNDGREDEGLVEAKQLKIAHPKNADVASILGAAYLRITPKSFKEADRELQRALELGCKRPELLKNIIQAKIGIEDWTGIRSYTKDKVSNDFGRDAALNAYVLASDELIKISKLREDYGRIAELAIESIERISAKIRRARLETYYFGELLQKRNLLAKIYVEAVERDNNRPGDKIKVFEAVARLSNADVLIGDIIRTGISALSIWWGDVEKRPVIDMAACGILQKMLGKLNGIESRMSIIASDSAIIRLLHSTRQDLEFRGAAVQVAIS